MPSWKKEFDDLIERLTDEEWEQWYNDKEKRKMRKMRKINFADHLEEHVARSLDECGIEFIHESESKDQILDFYLPFFDVYIEVKQYYTSRTSTQLSTEDNVIVVQGRLAVQLLEMLLRNIKIEK